MPISINSIGWPIVTAVLNRFDLGKKNRKNDRLEPKGESW